MILLTIMKPKKQRQAAAEIRQPQRIPVRPTWWLFHGMSEFDRQTTLILYLERPLTARLLRSPRLRRMSPHHPTEPILTNIPNGTYEGIT